MVKLRTLAKSPVGLGVICIAVAILLAVFPRIIENGETVNATAENVSAEMTIRTRKRLGQAENPKGEGAGDYLSMAKKGMTFTEMMWVVDDFLALGLNAEYPVEFTIDGYLGLRKAREKWYLRALVSGLRLNEEQKRQVEESIAVAREIDLQEFETYLAELKSFNHEGTPMKVFDGSRARRLTEPGMWLKRATHSPETICDLSDEQISHTWEDKITVEENGFQSPQREVSELLSDFARTQLLKSFDPTQSNKFPPDFEEMSCVFPLTAFQIEHLIEKFPDKVALVDIERLMILHPEQFAIYLLFYPRAANDLAKKSEEYRH